MIIEKTAVNEKQSLKSIYFFENARTAFKRTLRFLSEGGEYELLLPGYIGHSSREGSGIFDPVIEEKISFSFYKLDKNLNIVMEDLEKHLMMKKRKIVVLLVHYFGIPDSNINGIIKLCRQYDAVIIEDSAHALYSDFVDHQCGGLGDFTLYSLHKMLPFNGKGGAVKVNCTLNSDLSRNNEIYPFWNYDFYEIAEIRKQNAKYWKELLSCCSVGIKVLRPFRNDITYQTFPVLVNEEKRDRLYFELNDAGFGAVSLYHEMISPIREEGFNDALWVANHILNLPVHQDINKSDIDIMYQKMVSIIKE